MSEILRQLYASNPSGQYRLLTLELLHASFPDGAHRFVRGWDDVTLTLETGASVLFKASGIGIIPPRRGTQQKPSMTIQIDNVTLEVSQAIDAALEVGGPIKVIFREYVSTDLSAPQSNPTLLYAHAASADRETVQLRAGFRDIVNRRWPVRRYTTDLVPGLKHL